jgi:acyl phosphate:glycerol-3-phosphate acyltransferase
MLTSLLIAAVVGYLLGSLPFGYLVARAKGVNIFEVGSKNPGATNVRRVLGNGPGNLVLFLDALKGAAAAGWPFLSLPYNPGDMSLASHPNMSLVSEPFQLQAGVAGLVAAILGHSFSCFTKFKGGKSVATAAGGFAVVFPIGILVALAIFGTAVGVTRYVSLGSILAAVSLPVTAVVRHEPTLLVVVTATVAFFVILRHRANISRLLAGTESKMGRKPAAPEVKS